MSDNTDSDSTKSQDLKSRLKQMTQPFVDTLDSRLSTQIDKRVDQRVDDTLRDRLTVIERAVADLDRALREIQDRLAN